MTVQDILRQKGLNTSRISCNAPVIEAAVAMKREGVGALLVDSVDGCTIGILDERTVLAFLASNGVEAAHKLSGDVMQGDFSPCTRQTPSKELLRMMVSTGVRHLPVIEFGRVIGIVSMADVVALLLNDSKPMKGAFFQRAGLPEIYYGDGGALF